MDSSGKVLRLNELQRFGSFAVTGGLAAIGNLTTRYALSQVMTYEIAVAVAYLIGMTIAFVLARRFVFAASGKPWVSEFGRFAVVNLASFTLVWIISVGLAKIIFPQVGFDWHPEDIAHIIGVLSPIALSYYAHKHFSFKAPGASAGIGNRT